MLVYKNHKNSEKEKNSQCLLQLTEDLYSH